MTRLRLRWCARWAWFTLLLMGASRPPPLGCQVTADNAVAVTVAQVVSLTVAPSATVLVTPTQADYDAGSRLDQGPTVTVKANGPYTLKIQAQDNRWTATSGAFKLAGDLQWGQSPASTFVPLTTAPATVLVNGAGTTGQVVQMWYKSLWHETLDTPGDYSLAVRFTVTTP